MGKAALVIDSLQEQFPKRSGRILAQFSCGAASAVATKLAIEKYGDAVEIYYCDTGSEHHDNERFLQSCEVWFQRKINILRSEDYSDIWEVFESRRYISGPMGAPCTGAMKRIPSDKVWQIGDVEIFGYTADESSRLERFREQNNERLIECPLIDRCLTKEDCFGILDREGIRLPDMYKLGFRNNNCLGCVKARDSIDYWKRIRKFFPEKFERMAGIERDIGHTINRERVNGERVPIFLDEIPEGDPNPKAADPNIQCGLFCMAESDNFSR